MKFVATIGWILLALETLAIATMFVQRNVGDDAAGRGMATGFALILTPILLLAAALFLWGQRGGPAPAFWAGFGILAIPLILQGNRMAGEMLRSSSLRAGRALYGSYEDRTLTRLARAIERNDTTAVRALLAKGGIDFEPRSRRGRTILGRAVEHATGSYEAPEAVESVRLLLEAGARPIANAIEPEFSQGDLDAHLLVAYVFGGNSPNTLPLLDLLLSAGADPDTRNYEGQPLYFSTYSTLPKLEMLAKHGADFSALETTRTDRNGWTAAMTAAEFGAWDQVLFLLAHGVPADHVAPDGSSLKTILEAKGSSGEVEDGMAEVRRRLGL